MTETLAWGDYLTIGLYFAFVLAVGLWSTFNRNRGSTHGYFLAGKSMLWLPVGASIYASNVGAPMFIGLAGTAAASGIAVTIYEWHAVFILVSLGWIFVPVYVACGALTVPEYLRLRFGGKRIRMLTSCVLLLQYVLRNISGEIYCASVFLQLLLGWNLYLSVGAILAVVAVYTVIGGLRAVIFTDTLQTVVLVVGAIIVCVMSMSKIGGWEALQEQYMDAATNYSLYDNTSVYACGRPREDAFHIFRSPLTGDIPWTGATIGLTVLALFVWCQDQLIVQRCLSAKNIAHAKGGALVAAALKFLSFPMFVIPGMISRILYTDEVACADPDKCMSICKNPAGCSNIAYPVLVLRLLPVGLRGLMLAALLAGLMSTLTSVFNSASSVVTLDLWRQFRKQAGQAELMIVGRVTVLVLVAVSILWLPILQTRHAGLLWIYMASIVAYLAVPWCIAFLLALFWKRITEPGAFYGMVIGLVVGLIRMGLDFAVTAPPCGSGEPDNRFAVSAKVDFLHFTIINSILCVIIMVGISLFTRPRSEHQLHRVTWWTRHDTEEPEVSLIDDVTTMNDVTQDSEMLKPEVSIEPVILEEDHPLSGIRRCKRVFFSWVCGLTTEEQEVLSEQEKVRMRAKMTSIKEGPIVSKLLDTGAIVLLLGITFLFGYFA